ncbi:imidazole glycerol phosphate synthase subunit HisF [uncultured Rikenella sp.]|uniref:imidazole glycerol phosphate synthase subunit HisF n=1 Tax=uncultured Rikenella sp. TaxID=368003 RepID=UPI002616653D|nr:imidazole glycerol phosphate synthase subunit HisF [uncultured Rikenella sp.]
MLAKRIIPCLDIKDGRTVKGVNFVGLQNVGDPVELGRKYADEGADELVYLDISATDDGRKTGGERGARSARESVMRFRVGGGISTAADAGALLLAGADKVTVNSAAVRRPELIDEIAGRYGRQFIVVAIDARMDETGRWVVKTHGGRQPSERELFSWAREAQERGAGEILFTSMNHDGTKSGYPCETFARLASELSIPVIASGGAGTVDHIAEVLTAGQADAALAASIFHYGEIPIPVLKRALNERKISVRI